MSRRLWLALLVALVTAGAPGVVVPRLAAPIAEAQRGAGGRIVKDPAKKASKRGWSPFRRNRPRIALDEVKRSTTLGLDPGNGQRLRDRIRRWPKTKDFVILSLDGGGIRGVLTAKIIERIARERPGFLERVDAVAGTSTGAIVGTSIAAGIPPGEIVEFFQGRGPKIFKQTAWRKFKSLFGLIGAKYDVAALEQGFDDYFGDHTLDHLQKSVLIPTFLLDDGQGGGGHAEFFKNLDRPDATKVKDVLRATTAAPTFFKSATKHIDGGVAANDPVDAMIAEALAAGIPLSRIKVLSIGTGVNPGKPIKGGDWGLIRWAPELPNIMMDGPTNVTEYKTRSMLRGGYFRINPKLPKAIDLGDAKQIPTLLDVADKASLADPGMAKWAQKMRTNQMDHDEADAQQMEQAAQSVLTWIDAIQD
jgi:predicted acylesterase/phospholipase RssA